MPTFTAPRSHLVPHAKRAAEDDKLIPVEAMASNCCRSASCRRGHALAWRGPMASGALDQLIEADWGDAELILVDLPPVPATSNCR